MANIDQTGIPYSQYAAAYQKVYGKAPYLGPGYDNYYAQNPDAIYNPSFSTGQGQIPLSTLMAIAGAPGAGTAAPAAAPATVGGSQSYLQGSSPMANSYYFPPSGTPTAQQAMQYYVSMGGSPQAGADTAMQYYQAMQSQTPKGYDQNAFGIKQVSSNPNYTTLQNAQGKQISIDSGGNYFTIDSAGNHTPVSDADAQAMGFQSANPETQALKQMGQIDPATEKIRSQLAGSYLDPSTAANPTAADYQKYLDVFKGVDPGEYAARQGLGTSMDSYLKSVQDEYALGSQLDPVTQMQVEQQARKGQADRGNLYGSGQAAVEAMSTGQAGQALKQQRLGNLQTALGGEQSYLGSGLGMGSTAMQLYQQGLQNKANAQQQSLSYLGSGQSPYAAASGYVDRAAANAAGAAQGGPVYQPAALGAGQMGTAQQAPQYGLDVGAQAQSYFNSLNNFVGGGGATKNRGAAAGIGAASGAMSGAAAGAPLAGATYGLSIPIGAVVGGALGGASGYYS